MCNRVFFFESDVIPEQKTIRALFCDHGMYIFWSDSSMYMFTIANHCNYPGLVSNIQCEYCPALYARKGLLDRHMKNYHPDKKIVPDENEVYEKSDEINQGNLSRGIDNWLGLA